MNRRRLAALVVALLAIGLALGLPALQTQSSRAAPGDVPGAAPAAATGAYEYMAELSDEIGPPLGRRAGDPRADLVGEFRHVLVGAGGGRWGRAGYVAGGRAGRLRLEGREAEREHQCGESSAVHSALLVRRTDGLLECLYTA